MTQAQQHQNLSASELLAMALEHCEGSLASNGALVVKTGKRTGRSPKDRFIVKDDITRHSVEWSNTNQAFTETQFTKLWQLAEQHMQSQAHTFSSPLAIGADEHYQIAVTVVTDTAWQQLFCHNQFIRVRSAASLARPWQLLSAAKFSLDPQRDGVNSDAALIIDFTQCRVLVCGLHYAGEMKKAMFSVMNFLLPAQQVLPMHCAANVGENGDSALFFGLSGTGKTTLSADPNRYLIGDDEHGWGKNGIFNFEGGCYAKCIDLSPEREPVIWHALRSGAILENVVIDPLSKVPDYTDSSLSSNSRACYPLEHIEKRIALNRGNHPTAVIFLSCDLYGVLPPVALLSPSQAAYYFLSGYTALVGSTEVGSTEAIKSTFSACFGAPFFSRPPAVYADLLMHYLALNKTPVYLVNTGWSGGKQGGGGKRFTIPTTRAVISAILNQTIRNVAYETMPGFNFAIPTTLPGLDSKVLNPQKAWADPLAFTKQAVDLIGLFTNNFKRFQVAAIISQAGPQPY